MDEDDSPYCIETNRHVDVPDVDDARIHRVVSHVLVAEDCRAAEISVAVLDAEGIRDLNARYLGHDDETDVLAFDLSDDYDGSGRGEEAGSVPRLTGQVIVNADLARCRAAERGIEASAELMLYVVHGCLHLLGYDDHGDEPAARMHRREDELLQALGYGKVFEVPPNRRAGPDGGENQRKQA
ncbi:MAG: rRNA maturation RNase YbeY [Phycisphaerae bacterium]|nr:rRNA maturation RNase YbeY [Phycisphaerae bacterium]